MLKNNPKAITKDSDFVFIHFILNYMPIGLVGLLFAVILSAGMSSTSSELNALSATFIIDFYKRSFVKNKSENYYVTASKIATAAWGVLAIGFAMIFSLFDNLIEAVNIIGSLFYGVILGVFLTGFFIKRVKASALLISVVLSELIVFITYLLEKQYLLDFSYLWLNPLGCLSVMFFGLLLQPLFKKKAKG
jgi:Na+/proline symporter